MPDLTDAHKQLVVESAKKLRKAIDERNHQQADPIAEFDIAVDSGDEEEIVNKAIMMMILVGVVDPVRSVIGQYAELSKLLGSAEGRT